MNAGWMGAAALATCFAAFSALALAMERHYEAAYGRGATPGARARWLRAAGAAGLVAAWWACNRALGFAQGAVLWCGAMTAGALAAALVCSYAPRQSARLLAAGVALAVGAWLMAVWRSH